jgi:hypothetical protein
VYWRVQQALGVTARKPARLELVRAKLTQRGYGRLRLGVCGGFVARRAYQRREPPSIWAVGRSAGSGCGFQCRYLVSRSRCGAVQAGGVVACLCWWTLPGLVQVTCTSQE